jgi:Asp-tRNA(Asn)/Glu-tRNA(Gln) amidotransferase B subunit
VQQLRVDEFHRKMVEFLSNLLIKLNTLQEYHIDLRNWHGNFSMSGLKKILDTKVISNKQEFSLIRRSLINNKNQPQGVAEELGLKTIYTV